MTLPVPRRASNCSRCGTVVADGLRFCQVCAVKFNIAPSEMFTLQLGATKRPPYETRPEPVDTTGNDT